jgi:hypothetical protein
MADTLRVHPSSLFPAVAGVDSSFMAFPLVGIRRSRVLKCKKAAPSFSGRPRTRRISDLPRRYVSTFGLRIAMRHPRCAPRPRVARSLETTRAIAAHGGFANDGIEVDRRLMVQTYVARPRS